MIEQTLVLIKPDGVQRGLIGESIKRFEQRGFKIIGLKLIKIDENFAKKHYSDIAERRGEKVFKSLMKYITEGPVVAIVIQGVNAVENIRKIVGPTESSSATPGTIRGDFSHTSFSYSDSKNLPLKNLIHASGSSEEAKAEVALWFGIDELHEYKIAAEEHLF